MEDVNGSMFVLLLFLVLGVALWLSRDHWRTEQCWACHLRKPFLAPRCWSCGQWQRRPRLPLVLLGTALLLGQGARAHAQGVQFLDCAQVRLLADACDEEDEPAPTPRPPQRPVPLFTKDTVARDTPPVLLQMLQDPQFRTPAQARLFVAQQAERHRIMLDVQQLIQAEMRRTGAR